MEFRVMRRACFRGGGAGVGSGFADASCGVSTPDAAAVVATRRRRDVSAEPGRPRFGV
jgi:hypothetical protein